MTPFAFGWAVHDGLLLREKQAFPGASFWRGLMRTGAKVAPQVAKQAPRTAAEMAQELQRAARTARLAAPVTRPPVVAKQPAARPLSNAHARDLQTHENIRRMAEARGVKLPQRPAVPRLPAAPAVPAPSSARSLVSPTSPAPSVASAADDFDVKKFLEPMEVPPGPAPVPKPDPLTAAIQRHLHSNWRDTADESTRVLFPETTQDALSRVRSQSLLQRMKSVDPSAPIQYLQPNTPLRYPAQ